ncbi:MAG: RHS repeat-associated core domain-containing protein [Fimbriimonadaceae bacterium]|nr:RHS repeat-associated core domain-containing protein [Fimbriimonadaceae bacterium]
MTTTESGNTTTAYPLYDTHGNMVATLTKNAAGTSWNVGNLRSYDVWGAVRSGAATGGPSGRYVANLGHVQDDESGLISMRARYYEPGTGRFISEDPAGDGANWFVYCMNLPSVLFDKHGLYAEDVYMTGKMIGFIGLNIALFGWVLGSEFSTPLKRIQFLTNALVISGLGFAIAFSGGSDIAAEWKLANAVLGTSAGLIRAIVGMAVAADLVHNSESVAKVALAATLAYNMMIIGALVAIDAGVLE